MLAFASCRTQDLSQRFHHVRASCREQASGLCSPELPRCYFQMTLLVSVSHSAGFWISDLLLNIPAMAHVKIETIKNGPYIVTGEVELIDADGNKFPVEKRMALCRCGASTEKPFCDGTHSKIGFQSRSESRSGIEGITLCHSEGSRGISRMKIRVALVFAFSFLAAAVRAEKISLVGATVINPADGKVLPNATVVINGDKIERVSMGKQDAATLGRQVSCVGKFILPGYIDTHVHFFQSADLFTRPDGADFNSVRPYKDEVAWIKSHLDDTFARYIRCGITSVVDVGGPMWNFEVRKKANATAKAPRVAVAGPLISSVSREKLDLGDPPIVKIDTPDQARKFVRKLAEQKPDLVKIWYIVDKDHPVEGFVPSCTRRLKRVTRTKFASPCTLPSLRRRAPQWKKGRTCLCTA